MKRLSRFESSANAAEGVPRCARCDRAHPLGRAQNQNAPRSLLVAKVGRVVFGYLGLPDTCGRSWALEWARVPYCGKRPPPPRPAAKALDRIRDTLFAAYGSYGGTMLRMGKWTYCARRARPFWSRTKAKRWAMRWASARIGGRKTVNFKWYGLVEQQPPTPPVQEVLREQVDLVP